MSRKIKSSREAARNLLLKKYKNRPRADRDQSRLSTAAEYLVCADLLIRGLDATPNPHGWSHFDISARYGTFRFDVQVKAVMRQRPNDAPRTAQTGYDFYLAKTRKAIARYRDHGVELFALVAMDVRAVYYLPVDRAPRNLFISRQSFPRKAEGSLEQFLLEKTLL